MTTLIGSLTMNVSNSSNNETERAIKDLADGKITPHDFYKFQIKKTNTFSQPLTIFNQFIAEYSGMFYDLREFGKNLYSK